MTLKIKGGLKCLWTQRRSVSSLKAFLRLGVKNKSSIVTVALIMLRGGGLKVASLYLHQKRPSHSASARTATPSNYFFFAPSVQNINLGVNSIFWLSDLFSTNVFPKTSKISSGTPQTWPDMFKNFQTFDYNNQKHHSDCHIKKMADVLYWECPYCGTSFFHGEGRL